MRFAIYLVLPFSACLPLTAKGCIKYLKKGHDVTRAEFVHGDSSAASVVRENYPQTSGAV